MVRAHGDTGQATALRSTGPVSPCEISVIVPAHNSAQSLPPLLRALQKQTLATDRYEVIIVDNGSSDRTSDVARRQGVRVLRESFANRARARNRGAEVARSRLYAFTDADCVPDRRWLEALLRGAPKAPLVAGDVKLEVSERPNSVERYERLWRFGQESWVAQGWAATANLLVHADAFGAVAGFDDTWRHIGEDVDFCFRARDAGYELDFCAEAVVHHEGDRRLRPLLERSYRHGYSVNQAYYRLGAGFRAWRDPWPAVWGDRALTMSGVGRDQLPAEEWRRMRSVARISYAARVVGSAWAELTGVR